VDTSKSVVTLSGTVRTEDEKVRAEGIAKDTKGVSSVVNNLSVVPKKGKN
jgi:osmotically-inducible protein OsmY